MRINIETCLRSLATSRYSFIRSVFDVVLSKGRDETRESMESYERKALRDDDHAFALYPCKDDLSGRRIQPLADLC